MTIQTEIIQEMVEIVSGLVREGLTFSTAKKGGVWIITLLGGY